MKKDLYSLKELQAKAVDHFNRLGVQVLHATGDGEFFMLQNRALLHANGNLPVYEIHAEGSLSHEHTLPDIEALKVEVAETSDSAILQKRLLDIVAGGNSVEHVKVITDRLDELFGNQRIQGSPQQRDNPDLTDKQLIAAPEPLQGNNALEMQGADDPLTSVRTPQAHTSGDSQNPEGAQSQQAPNPPAPQTITKTNKKAAAKAAEGGKATTEKKAAGKK